METLIKLFERDLDKLIFEIESFENEEMLWITKGKISNSAGNLCLHLVGNLNHFIGAVMGKTGYVRNRQAEFDETKIEKSLLIGMLMETKNGVLSVLQNFDEKNLKSKYPIQVFGEEMTYDFFLIHLSTHLNYHLGQINYLRRILEI